jgi:hypothetical protein
MDSDGQHPAIRIPPDVMGFSESNPGAMILGDPNSFEFELRP